MALRDGEWVLGAERHYTQVIGEVDAVDDERDKAELMEVTGEQLIKGIPDRREGLRQLRLRISDPAMRSVFD